MFDPYLEWLGIPAGQRPPTHYQLLGVSPAERDPLRIEEAAARQAEVLEAHRSGPHATECLKLLAEVALAKATLTDPDRRATYEAQLKGQPWWQPEATPPPEPAPASPEPWWKAEAPAASAPPPTEPAVPPAPPKPSPPPAAPPPAPPPARTAPRTPAAPQPPRTEAPRTPPPKPRRPVRAAEPAEEREEEDFPRRPRRQQGGNAGLLLVGAGFLVLVIGAGITILALRTPSAATRPEQAKANPKAEPTTTPAEPSTPPKTRPDPNPPPGKENGGPLAADAAREPRTWKPHAGAVRAVAVAPDGAKLLTAGEDMAVFAFPPDADRPTKLTTLKAPAVGAAFLPDGGPVVADGGAIRVLRPTGAVRQQFATPAGGFEALAVGGDGKLLLTGSTDGSMRLWAVGQDGPVQTFEVSANKPVTAVALSADGRLALAGCADGTLSAWDASGKLLKRWKAHADAVTALAITPDGKLAISGGADKSAVIWDPATGKELKRLPGHDGPVLAVAFVNGGRSAASGGTGGVLRLWETEGGRLVQSSELGGRIYSLAADPGGRFVLAGCGDGVVKLQPTSPATAVAAGKPPANKFPVPAETDLVPALAALREAHAEELKRDKPEDVRNFVALLLAKATAADEMPFNRFAYFRTAREQALKAGDLGLAMRVIDALDDWFEVDGLEERAAVLEALGESLPPPARKAVAEEALKLLRQAESGSRPELVERLLTTATAAAKASGTQDLADRAEAVAKRLQEAALEGSRAAAAAAKLKQDPDDPDANLAYGRHLCFRRGDWDRGLPMLAKGKDRSLAELAKQDLAGPPDAAGQARLAAGWFGLAESEPAADRANLYGRSKLWYEKAIANGLAGLDKVEAAARLKKVEKLTAAPTPKDGPPATVGKEPPPQPGAVLWRNFNTLRNEKTATGQWKIEGNHRFDPAGLRLQDGAPELASKFRLLENWRLTVALVGDGRQLSVSVCGEDITVSARSNAAVTLVIDRKGGKLGYTVLDTRGRPTKQDAFNLTADKQGPTAVTVRLQGSSTGGDRAILRGVVVSGAVQPAE